MSAPRRWSRPESLAMYGFTRALDPLLTLSYHTQGRVIYWQYDGYDVPGSAAIARQFAAVSGYAVADTPYASGHAGYKDWFIQDYRRPGFTIEAGSGENPLPLSPVSGHLVGKSRHPARRHGRPFCDACHSLHQNLPHDTL